MGLVQTVNDFDKLLVQVTEETIKYCLGDVNTAIIWNYMEERDYPKSEIQKDLKNFRRNLET